MTCEACEYVDTFLKLSPDYAVILNVDEDHLEYFKNLDNIIASFKKFAQSATKMIIVNGDDPNSMLAVVGVKKPVITFGFAAGNDYYPANIEKISPNETAFDLLYRGDFLARITLRVPGRHNLLNAVAACVAALQVGVEPSELAAGLAEFRGAGRRFEFLGERGGVTIADDYAHHPAELKVTLEVAKELGFQRVWAVFQPFTYSRTSLLLQDFAAALAIADEVVMSEIMGAREKNTYNIYTKDLAALVPGSVWFEGFAEIAAYVMERAEPGDLVITLGCGDVYKCARMMLE
jgi:UDP-N-acetylmuramate--alanine ligase